MSYILDALDKSQRERRRREATEPSPGWQGSPPDTLGSSRRRDRRGGWALALATTAVVLAGYAALRPTPFPQGTPASRAAAANGPSNIAPSNIAQAPPGRLNPPSSTVAPLTPDASSGQPSPQHQFTSGSDRVTMTEPPASEPFGAALAGTTLAGADASPAKTPKVPRAPISAEPLVAAPQAPPSQAERMASVSPGEPALSNRALTSGTAPPANGRASAGMKPGQVPRRPLGTAPRGLHSQPLPPSQPRSASLESQTLTAPSRRRVTPPQPRVPGNSARRPLHTVLETSKQPSRTEIKTIPINTLSEIIKNDSSSIIPPKPSFRPKPNATPAVPVPPVLRRGQQPAQPAPVAAANQREPAETAPEPPNQYLPHLRDLSPALRRELKALELNAHVYKPVAAERMVIINMRRYREKQKTKGGAMVERITRRGVELSFKGQAFRLSVP